MTKTQRQKRISYLIRLLSDMGSHGWHHYTFRDWQPLEAELRRLQNVK